MLVFLFPGQGAQAPEMFDLVFSEPEFRERYELICNVTGLDLIATLENSGTGHLDSNLFSSLMTALVSSVALDRFRAQTGTTPTFAAGYSVGQWSAMYSAGMVTFEELVRTLALRVALMNDCVALEPSAMCAVIGLPESRIEPILAGLRDQGLPVYISNYNCFAQYSISGTVEAIETAEALLKVANPKKLVRLPVSGGWHCPLLNNAAERFSSMLDVLDLRPPQFPVVDNVTGAWLPTEGCALRAALSRHLNHPVRWEAGVKQLLSAGASEFVELGYGRMLTNFGLFIDRDATWRRFN